MIRKRVGHIVNIASMSAHHPIARDVIYESTKFGVRGFSEALNQELRLDGHGKYLYVTAVYPYIVATQAILKESIRLRFKI